MKKFKEISREELRKIFQENEERPLSEGRKGKGTSLRNANLMSADLRDADLRGADLTGANLAGTDLRGTKLKGANFKDAIISATKVLKREDLVGAKNIESYDGFIFEHDEIEEERTAREQRTEVLFDINKKGDISCTLPAKFSPIQVAQALGLISLLVEGVRLALSADYETDEQLSFKVNNPTDWTKADEKYAARLTSISMASPVAFDIGIIEGLGTFILGAGALALGAWKAWLNYKVKNKALDQDYAVKNRVLDEFGNLPLVPASGQGDVVKEISSSVVDDLSQEQKNIAQELIKQLSGRVDRIEERTNKAIDIIVSFLTRWRVLIGEGKATLKINGKDLK
ncbi:MAG: pentapeptide repeat-containing protein [Desulfarculaceae bacterium]|jgi:hypothetical protein